MHEKRDYLMIQIEELGRVLGKILSDLLGLKAVGKVSETYDFTKQSLISELDIDIELLFDMSDSEFSNFIKNVLFNSSQLYSNLAEIMVETGNLQSESNKKRKHFEKALILYTMEKDSNKTFSPDRHSKIESLQANIIDLRKKL